MNEGLLQKVNGTLEEGLPTGDTGDIEKNLNQHDLEVKKRIDAIRGNIKGGQDRYQMHKVEIQPLEGFELICSTISNCLFCLCLPVYLLSTIKVVGQRQVMLFTSFGKVIAVRDEPGCICYPRVCCTEFLTVST